MQLHKALTLLSWYHTTVSQSWYRLTSQVKIQKYYSSHLQHTHNRTEYKQKWDGWTWLNWSDSPVELSASDSEILGKTVRVSSFNSSAWPTSLFTTIQTSMFHQCELKINIALINRQGCSLHKTIKLSIHIFDWTRAQVVPHKCQIKSKTMGFTFQLFHWFVLTLTKNK
jgi:hypothetical protein